eukprot:CAMPEP_0179099616 /NCGR_PEP_ID=MMETSP0796-20121207/45964_1 /TAXON_ID=73915 /ORGANISM="Pyrodinium bahamense, Strain pbaha01" /LENGTH=262 /DNA_ID=CAMNT_0020797417 /DNA_START=61 /DNA_END=849 /DNA_ORIENTATION=+
MGEYLVSQYLTSPSKCFVACCILRAEKDPGMIHQSASNLMPAGNQLSSWDDRCVQSFQEASPGSAGLQLVAEGLTRQVSESEAPGFAVEFERSRCIPTDRFSAPEHGTLSQIAAAIPVVGKSSDVGSAKASEPYPREGARECMITFAQAEPPSNGLRIQGSCSNSISGSAEVCWDGVRISARVALGSVVVLVAVVEVMLQVMMETIRTEEPIEAILARGSISPRSLASIPEEEEEEEEEENADHELKEVSTKAHTDLVLKSN